MEVFPPKDKDSQEARVRREGYPDYSVKPPGARDLYTAIVYAEPFAGRNLRAFGFDMFTEPVRRAAMQAAADSGEVTMSGRVTLVQEIGGFCAFPTARQRAIWNIVLMLQRPGHGPPAWIP